MDRGQLLNRARLRGGPKRTINPVAKGLSRLSFGSVPGQNRSQFLHDFRILHVITPESAQACSFRTGTQPNLVSTGCFAHEPDFRTVRTCASIGTAGHANLDGLFSQTDLDHQQRVKCAYDAKLLLNPGKVFPTLHRCAELGRVHVHGGKLPFPDLPRF